MGSAIANCSVPAIVVSIVLASAMPPSFALPRNSAHAQTCTLENDRNCIPGSLQTRLECGSATQRARVRAHALAHRKHWRLLLLCGIRVAFMNWARVGRTDRPIYGRAHLCNTLRIGGICGAHTAWMCWMDCAWSWCGYWLLHWRRLLCCGTMVFPVQPVHCMFLLVTPLQKWWV